MEKTNEEIIAYAIKMRKRGDTYTDVSRYLKNQSLDEKEIKEVLVLLNKLEKNGELVPNQARKERGYEISMIFGMLFLVAGIVLIIFLWNEGFIASLPIALILIGILGIRRALR